MSCNTKKTVYMVFKPARKDGFISSEVPLLKPESSSLLSLSITLNILDISLLVICRFTQITGIYSEKFRICLYEQIF